MASMEFGKMFRTKAWTERIIQNSLDGIYVALKTTSGNDGNGGRTVDASDKRNPRQDKIPVGDKLNQFCGVLTEDWNVRFLSRNMQESM